MVCESEDPRIWKNFKLRAVAAAAGQTFIGVGGRSRQAQAAGVDESLIAWGWCAVVFFAHVSGFFTDDVVGCQKTHHTPPRGEQTFIYASCLRLSAPAADADESLACGRGNRA